MWYWQVSQEKKFLKAFHSNDILLSSTDVYLWSKTEPKVKEKSKFRWQKKLDEKRVQPLWAPRRSCSRHNLIGIGGTIGSRIGSWWVVITTCAHPLTCIKACCNLPCYPWSTTTQLVRLKSVGYHTLLRNQNPVSNPLLKKIEVAENCTVYWSVETPGNGFWTNLVYKKAERGFTNI
jgi:hypothetical protein